MPCFHRIRHYATSFYWNEFEIEMIHLSYLRKRRTWSVAQELIYFLDKLFYKKRTTKFHWKNLLLRTTLKIYFTTTTITTSVGWPTVVIGRSGKGYWRRCSFPSYFRYIWHFILPKVGNFYIKGKLIFIFILLANRPTGNNTHKNKDIRCSKASKDDYHGSFLHRTGPSSMYVKFTKHLNTSKS